MVAVAALTGSVLAGSLGHVAAASNSLGVNPRRDYTIESGSKVSDILNVTNLSKTDDLTVNINIIDFGPKNETGAPSLMLTAKEPTRWSLKPYMTIAKSVSISAGKSTNVPFTIAIPAKVGAGSYYGAVRYSTAGGDNSANVSLTSSSATLIFVRVPGEANDALRIKQFGAFTPTKTAETGSFGKLYVGAAPHYLAYRLVNTGNVAEQPTGSASIKNLFGKQVKIFEKANPNTNIVLIDQTRRIDLCLNEVDTSSKDRANNSNADSTSCEAPHLLPGRYTAKLALLYGDNGSSSHELGAVASFWYLPIWFVVALLVGVLFIAGIVWLIVHAIRGHHRSFNARR